MTTAQREKLEGSARRPTTSQALALRARVILLISTGLKIIEVADRLGLNDSTVSKWRSRFIQGAVEGLADAPRSGAPLTITDDGVERVVVKTLQEMPRIETHWSTRSMAAATGMSQTAISRIWRAFGLQPHRVESFRLASDPYFIEKVRDVVGLCLNPTENAVVLCVNEKSQITRILAGPRCGVRPAGWSRAGSRSALDG